MAALVGLLIVNAAAPVSAGRVDVGDHFAPGAPPVARAYVAPLVGALVVLHPFGAPESPYAAGERGVDLVAAGGSAVLASGAGTVRFAGVVAGRGVVVIAHYDGIATEYEPVAPSVAAGQSVGAGDVLGVVSGVHSGCPADACLHWGARRGSTYFDPMSLLRPLGTVRLLPW